MPEAIHRLKEITKDDGALDTHACSNSGSAGAMDASSNSVEEPLPLRTDGGVRQMLIVWAMEPHKGSQHRATSFSSSEDPKPLKVKDVATRWPRVHRYRKAIRNERPAHSVATGPRSLGDVDGYPTPSRTGNTMRQNTV